MSTEQGELHQQLAIVTGANRGIGRAIVKELGVAGAFVVGTYRSIEGKQDIIQTLKDNGAEGEGLWLELKKQDTIHEFSQEVHSAYEKQYGKVVKNAGKVPVSILVNNAGITRDKLMMRMPDEAWDEVIATNLTGPFKLTKQIIPEMVKAKYGRIIWIGSIAARGHAGQANYAASKAGIEGLSRSIALEYGSRNITSNVVAPGFVETSLTDQMDLSEEQKTELLKQVAAGRVAQPEEIARVVRHIASPDSGYINGSVITIDGATAI
jgi:3-oxoacyl-[acyl-carrier protein] reductase